MRHALISVSLIQEARAAADAEADELQAHQRPAERRVSREPRPRRLATLFRRARARTLGLRAESPGGGA